MSHSLIYKNLHASTPVYISISLRHHSQKEMLKHLHQHTYLQFVRMLLSYHETKEYSNKRISPSLLSDTTVRGRYSRSDTKNKRIRSTVLVMLLLGVV